MSQLIKISLLAKYEIAREGLRNILSGESFQIQASVADASALFDAQGAIVDDVDCHVIVVDGGDSGFGLDACRRLAAKKIHARLALLFDHYVFEDVVEAFQIGVDAVIVKEILCAPLVESIKLAALGERCSRRSWSTI